MLRSISPRVIHKRNFTAQTGLAQADSRIPRLSTRLPTPVRAFTSGSQRRPENTVTLSGFEAIRAVCKPLTCRSANPEHATMQDRIRTSLDERITFDKYVPALHRMLGYIGLEDVRAPAMCSFILTNLLDDRPLDLIEKRFHGTLQQTIEIPNGIRSDLAGPVGWR